METRRTVLKYLTGAMGASACRTRCTGVVRAAAERREQKPNIVCIVGEGLRWDELSSTGNKLIQTPNLDRIGREGCTFRNGIRGQRTVPAVARNHF